MRAETPHLPAQDWGRSDDRHVLASDVFAAVIVTSMLIPQPLAYAILAGRPPEIGPHAPILGVRGHAGTFPELNAKVLLSRREAMCTSMPGYQPC